MRGFQGTNETHLSTFVYLSQVVSEWVEPHLNLGIDFNADDVNRGSFLYAVGVTMLAGRDLGLMIDFLGRSEFEGVPVRIPPQAIDAGGFPSRPPDTYTAADPCTLDPRSVINFPVFPERIKRNDIVDFSFGLRYPLGTRGSIYVGGIVPLNDDGFRAGFIPSGGVEYTF